LIFVTAHAEHAVQAFELDAVDYLTKPVRLERLQQALQKVERLLKQRQSQEIDDPQEVLLIQDRSRTERLPLSEVLVLKAELKYITVRTLEKDYLLDGSLNDLEKKYATYFLRIHRNALVARHAIRALEKHEDPQEGEGWAVRLHGLSELLVVSRRQLAAVRDVIAGHKLTKS
jgi:two-component system response regulator AlgR